MIKALLCSVLGIGTLASAQTKLHLTVDAGDLARENTPVWTTIPGGGDTSMGELVSGSEHIPVQIVGKEDGLLLMWVQPKLAAHEKKEYELNVGPSDAATFHYANGEGYRDLLLGDVPVLRQMFDYKTDAKDKNKSSKPFTHVFGMNGEGYITKGPGGMESHHRGIFFGFGTQYGNFWDCLKPGIDQHHAQFVTGQEFAGPIAARSVELTNWIANGKQVIHDRRRMTAWNVAPGVLLMDWDFTMNSDAGDVKLINNSHHAGFHFRAADEVAGTKPGLHTGNATYVRPESAKLNKDDEWRDCPWVACSFSIKGNPYVVMHMDGPGNPKSVYSTRPYGRFGASFNDTLSSGKPMDLKYRVIVFDAKKSAGMDLAKYTGLYSDFVSPVKVEVK